jgi:AAA domain
MKPEMGIIESHLCHLFGWTSNNNKCEVRCIDPRSKKIRSEFFKCHDYASAASYAYRANQSGYNCYVTVNPLKPETGSYAKDTDVAAARWHFNDVDGTDDLDQAIARHSEEFVPSMIVVTGEIPSLRFHAYWFQSDTVDPVQWTKTQRGLAAEFESDPSVINPSRIMRLAGTVSYPDERKAKKGYVPELVTLIVTDLTPIDSDRFAAIFQEPEKLASEPSPTETYEPSAKAANGLVPICVISQALSAIPPLTGDGRRKEWLALGFAVKAANPAARSVFETWQRLSPLYDRTDDRLWDTINPQAGSYPNLFARAVDHDPYWWRGKDMMVETWWCRHINETFGTKEAQVAQPATTTSPAEPAHSTLKFRRYKMSDLKNQPTPKWLIRDLLFQQQVGVVYAPPSSFKSFLAIDLCSRLVRGLDWQGRKLKSSRVLYVAGEGFPMFRLRRLAWLKHNGLPDQDDGLEVIDSAVDLTDTASVTQFIVEMQMDSGDVGLVVFDTLSTCTAGQNESDSGVMTSAIENAKLIGRMLNAAVLLIHHPGKDASRGARGHSSLKGNVDTEWVITRHEKEMHCTLRVSKQKDGEDGQIFHFAAHRIPLGLLDDDEQEMFSLALASCEGLKAEQTAPGRRDFPGETISEQEADRRTIVVAMKAGDSLSTSKVAELVYQAMNCKRRAASDRVRAAVPLDWTAVCIGPDLFELRRVVVNENLHLIEMRRA